MASILSVHISGITKFLTLSHWGVFDSVKNFVTNFVTLEIWTLNKDKEYTLKVN